MSNLTPKKVSVEQKYYIFALKIAGDFGFTLAAPVLIASLAGQYLDKVYNSRPLFFTILLILSALVTADLIYKKSKKYGQQFQDLDKK